MHTIIAHASEAIRRQLQAAASRASDAATMHAIARTMAHLEEALWFMRAEAVQIIDWYPDTQPDRGPKVILIHTPTNVDDGSVVSTVTVIGNSGNNTPWSCTCGGDPDAYQHACPHLLAGRLTRAVWQHITWQRQRVERRAALAEAFEAEAAAIRAAHAAKAVYDDAARLADRASIHRVGLQQAVWRDDYDALDRGLADPDDPSDDADDLPTTLLTRVAA